VSNVLNKLNGKLNYYYKTKSEGNEEQIKVMYKYIITVKFRLQKRVQLKK